MKKYITIDKKYLLIPVCAEKELKTISISCQGEKIYEFNVPVKEKPDGHYGFHYYAPVNMEGNAIDLIPLSLASFIELK